ncbi:ribonuclease H-like domain-containing protein [Tanacetum coccineum]
MDPINHSTPTSTKLPILDTGKFEQWKFRIQQYLQHEHYALWEVIEFGDSYKVPPEKSAKDKSLTVSTASTDVIAANLSYDTVCAFIATQPNGSQIKYEDITQIDDDDIKEMDIKWNLALLSMRADRIGVIWMRKMKTMLLWLMKRKFQHNMLFWPNLAQVQIMRIRVLERVLELRDNKIENLKNELDEIKKDKESIDFKIENFENASKNLDSLLGNQRLDKDKKALGFNEYSVVPPPPAQVYSPPKKDLSWMGLPEFVDDTVTDYSRPSSSVDVFVKETSCPSVSKDNNTKNPRKPTMKYAKMYRNTSQSPKVMSNNFSAPIIEEWDSEDESEVDFTLNETVRSSFEQEKFDKFTKEVVGKKETPKQNHPRGNQRNWNNQKSQQLGKDFVMQNKACYNCGSFEHLKFDCKQNTRVNKGKIWSRVDNNHDNMKYPYTLNSAYPKLTSFKPAHSHVKRPFVRKTAVKNKVWVPTARTKVPTVGSKVPTAKPTVAAVKGNRGKAVKASACWIWKPKQNQLDQGSKLNGVSGIPQDNIDDKGY